MPVTAGNLGVVNITTTTTTTTYVDFYTAASYLGTSGAVYRVYRLIN